MKRIIVITIVSAMLFVLCSCGKSESIKAAEDAIAAIGEVTVESEAAIANAEKLYGILTDSEKAEVENRLELVEAREAFDELKGQCVYDNAKLAYEKLNNVAALCTTGMDDIYGAWYFGIYDADEWDSSSVLIMLSMETPSFTDNELQAALKELGISAYSLTSSWEGCVYVVEMAHVQAGTYEKIKTLLEETHTIMQELTDKYGDYNYYPKLKEYYAKVSSYAEFFESPTGSFNQLANTINDYENTIRTYQTDVGFLF